MEKRHKFRRINQAAGTLVLVALALLVAGLYFSSQAQRWFERTDRIEVLLPEEGAFGLREGAEVMVQGVTAGWVRGVHVRNQSLVAVIKVRREFRDLIRVDSAVRLQRELVFAGDAHLEIERGEGPVLPKGTLLAAQAPEEFMDRINLAFDRAGPLVESAEEFFSKWTALAADLQETRQELDSGIESLQQLIAGIERGEGAVGRLLRDPELADEMETLVRRASESLDQMRLVIDNLQEGTARLPEIGEGLARETLQLPALTLQARQTLLEIEIFFDGLQRHWLFRGSMDQPDPEGRIPPWRLERGAR
jgi:phospholipid/cholesterol/gamma-HCH transport system substrate-binding protein